MVCTLASGGSKNCMYVKKQKVGREWNYCHFHFFDGKLMRDMQLWTNGNGLFPFYKAQ